MDATKHASVRQVSSKDAARAGTDRAECNQSLELTIRLAMNADAPQVADVLTLAAAWLEKTGHFNDWEVPAPLSIVKEQIRRQLVYVSSFEPASPIVGTLEFHLSDERWWGNGPPEAAYVHRLAVLPQCRNRGIGAVLLRWASTRALSIDRNLLRLDCPANNKRLRAYYEAIGFRPVSIKQGSSTYIAALYEMDLR